jgi:hypothetical protein
LQAQHWAFWHALLGLELELAPAPISTSELAKGLPIKQQNKSVTPVVGRWVTEEARGAEGKKIKKRRTYLPIFF